MVKTAQSVAHRLKEDDSSDESGKDTKPAERNHIGIQDVGVKVCFKNRFFWGKEIRNIIVLSNKLHLTV